jgi:transmembrane sensor
MKVRVQDVIAWKDGVLIFCETPFHEVALKLGRWFNADIQIADPSVANYRFTGTFTSESLDQVLELLTISTPIDYSSSQRTILKNRSFSKQEIKIWKNSGAKKIKNQEN